MSTMRLVVDARGQGMPAEVSVDRLSQLLADQKSQLWLDISDPGPAEVALLRREFGFHELALEDVTKPHERPRCDAYEGYYFIVVYAGEHAGDTFLPQELNLFWGENYLVTIHRRPAAVLAVLEEARPQDAGRAFLALGRWDSADARSRLVVHPPERVSREVGSLPDSNPLHVLPKRWHEELIPLAAKGLSSDQLRFLRRVVANPDYRLFRTFAAARDSDILGSRYTFAQPQRDLIFFRTLPLARLSSVERAFQTAFARAALELSEGRPRAAEATLREAANGGLLMINNGLVLDAVAGSWWAKKSLLALADLYDATGRGTEAARIRHDVDVPSMDPLPPSLTRKDHDVHDIRDALPSVAARADVVPGLKWEYLVSVQALNVVAFCVREWTFDDDYESWRVDLRRHMVRRASDARFFDWITDPPRSRTNCPGRVDSGAEQTDSLHRAVDQLSTPTP